MHIVEEKDGGTQMESEINVSIAPDFAAASGLAFPAAFHPGTKFQPEAGAKSWPDNILSPTAIHSETS